MIDNTPEELVAQIKDLKADVVVQEQTIRELKQQLVGVCRHRHSTYYPDPSGNNGSFYECDACEKYSKYGFPNSVIRRT